MSVEWYHKHKEIVLQKEKQRRKDFPDKFRDKDLKRTYGITLAYYIELLTAQGGACAICSNPETDTHKGKIKRLAVDHDHKTGKIRGLLCGNCNRAIGMIKENQSIALSIVKYLRKHK